MLTAEEYRRAEFGYTLAESRRGFRIHAAVYALVMTALSVLNAVLWISADAAFPWAAFPLVGWGIGLALHFVYGFRGAAREARARQLRVERFAERERELA